MAEQKSLWDSIPEEEDGAAIAGTKWDQIEQSKPAGKQKAPETSSWSKIKSAGAGFGQGTSFGFGDELAGTVGAVAETAPGIGRVYDYLNKKWGEHALGIEGASDLPYQKKDPMQAYREARDHARSLNREAQRKNPWSYGIGEVAGGITSGLATGGAGGAGRFGKAGQTFAKGRGWGPWGQRVASGAAEAAPFTGLYGLGASEADVTKGEILPASGDVLFSGVLGALTGGLVKSAPEAGKGVIKRVFPKLRKEAKAEKAVVKATEEIGERAEELVKVGAKGEAKIMQEMAEEPGSLQGLKKRRRVLKGPVDRQTMQKRFFDNTEKVWKSLKKRKESFDSKIRMEEASKNLEGLPSHQSKKMTGETVDKAFMELDALTPNKILMGELAEDYSSEAVQKVDRELRKNLEFDQSLLAKGKAVLERLSDDLEKSTDTLTIYKNLNLAKQKMASLQKYGKQIGPMERETLDKIHQVEKMLSGILEDESAFGAQALRHKEINKAYSNYLNKMENLSKKFMENEKTSRGVEPYLSSSKMQTSMVQVDELRGMDRTRFFEEFLGAAKEFSEVLDDTPLGSSIKDKFPTTRMLKSFEPTKNLFKHDQTLHNQFSKLSWQKGVQNAAAGGQGPIPGMASAAAGATRVPGLGSATRAITGALGKQQKTLNQNQQLLYNLFKNEQDLLKYQKGGGWLGENLRELVMSSPEQFGKYATPLQNAAKSGSQAVAVVNHLFNQYDPNYRELQRKRNNQKEPN